MPLCVLECVPTAHTVCNVCLFSAKMLQFLMMYYRRVGGFAVSVHAVLYAIRPTNTIIPRKRDAHFYIVDAM